MHVEQRSLQTDILVHVELFSLQSHTDTWSYVLYNPTDTWSYVPYNLTSTCSYVLYNPTRGAMFFTIR